MSISNLTNTFIIFFSNLPNIEGQRRLVRMRQFVDNGLGDKIEILENLVIPILFQYSAIITVKADSLEAVEKALEPAKAEFKLDIIQSDNHQRNTGIDQFNCCLLIPKKENNSLHALSEGNMNVHSCINLPESSDYKQLILVNTEQMVDVFLYTQKHLTNRHPYISQVTSISDYLKDSLQKPSNKDVKEESKLMNPQDTAGEGHILNQGTSTVYYTDTGDSNPNLYDLLKNRKEIISTGNQPVQPNVHFWETLRGNYAYDFGIFKGNQGNEYFPTNINTDAPFATKINTVGKSNLLAFNLPSKETFHLVSDLGTWLNNLFNTDKYDAPWPESIYTGDDLDAYNNIIAQLRANHITSLPRDGGMDATDLTNNVSFPTDGSIKKEAYDCVMKDLLNEISYITVHAEEWFGGGGYFHALTNTTAIFAQIGIDRAVELMKLPAHKSEITVILDAIFGELISVISLIPEVGSTLSTVLKLAWNYAKMTMDPGKPAQPIQTIIANLEKDLSDYLKSIEDSNSAHLGIITGNWGKLQEFSLGAINLIKINPEMFGMKIKEKDVDVPTPSEYIDAIENAWRIICYKALYPGHYTINNRLSYSKNEPTPIFNREAKKYHFSYHLKCDCIDPSKKKYSGWAEMTYMNDAPIDLLDDLFGKDNLNLNPIEFYMGYNGWKSELPKYDNGLSYDSPWVSVYL